MAKTKTSNKFKAIEKNAENLPSKKIEDLKWEGEEVTATSDTKLEDDRGTGQAIVIRFFEFGTNLEEFKKHKPTAQQLFDSHRKGILSLLWRDGLKPFEGMEPRVIFSKNNMKYQFIIACIPSLGNVLTDKPMTLSQLLIKH